MPSRRRLGSRYTLRSARQAKNVRVNRNRALRLESLETRRVLATVNVLHDTSTADGEMTLREAIAAAHSTGEDVEFDTTLFSTPRTISLTQGQIEITKAISIVGNDNVTVAAAPDSRHFYIVPTVTSPVEVSISNLTLIDGSPTGPDELSGGSIFSTAYLHLDGVRFFNNQSEADGGALYSGYRLNASNLVVQDNHAAGKGGGIHVRAIAEIFAPVTSVWDSSVSNSIFGGSDPAQRNTALHGGGVYVYIKGDVDDTVSEWNSPVVDISQCQFVGNMAAEDGGGLCVINGGGYKGYEAGVYSRGGHLELTLSTFDGNEAGDSGGGAILLLASYDDGDVASTASMLVDQCRVNANEAFGRGGGLAIENNFARTEFGPTSIARVEVRNSTISNNIARGNFDEQIPAKIGDQVGGGGIWFVANIGPSDSYTANPAATSLITQCTISGNKSRNGGGVALQGDVHVTHSTIVYNEAGLYEQIENEVSSGGGVLIMSPVLGSPMIDWPARPHKKLVPTFSHTILARNYHPSSPNIGLKHNNAFPEQIGTPLSVTPNTVFLADICIYEDLSAPEHAYWRDLWDVVLEFNKSIIDDRSGPLTPCDSPEGLLGVNMRFHEDDDVIHIAPYDGPIDDDPLLHPLRDNGGFLLPDGTRIWTHALLCSATNPAIDSGDYIDVHPELEYDQRGPGHPRVVDSPDEDLYAQIDIGAFEIGPRELGQFSADFNGDLVVNAADLQIWRDNFGMRGATSADGDANGDGLVNGLDLIAWREDFGATSSLADFNGDMIVDGSDFLIWMQNVDQWTNATQSDGDADGDGDVDGNDFLIWQLENGMAIDPYCKTWMETIHEVNAFENAAANGHIVVSTLIDENDGDYSLGDLSLREALVIANTISGANMIVFANNVTGTITLTGTPLSVNRSVEISGLGAELLTIDGDGLSRVFSVYNASSTLDVTISGLTITGGYLANSNEGSGIYSSENLTLNRVVLRENLGGRSGGGLYHVTGNLTIVDCTFHANTALWGAGLTVDSPGAVSISGSTFSENDAVTHGSYGGSGSGGGVYLLNIGSTMPAVIKNSTFSGNEADNAAGALITQNAYATLVNNTIAFNDAGNTTGGVYKLSGGLTLHNTIVAKNAVGGTTQSDASGSLNAGSSHNFFGAGAAGSTFNSGTNNQIGSSGLPIDPKLDALAENGGPTKTHKLQYDSSAIDAGSTNAAVSLAGLATDQRGYNRYIYLPGSTYFVDIGAYEYGLVVRSNSNALNTTFSRTNLTLRDALSLSDSLTTLPKEQIEFDPLAYGTITLGGSQLTITSGVDIIGPGADLLTIDANGGSRVIAIDNSLSSLANVSMQGVTITGGYFASPLEGPGIYNKENLTLDRVVVTENFGGRSGGGLYHITGNLTIINSTFHDNEALWGAGVAVNTTGSVRIGGSTFSSNYAVSHGSYSGSGSGGGLFLQNTTSGTPALITNSTFSGNMGDNAASGLITSSAYAIIVNSTIAFNDAVNDSGGVYRFNGGGVTLHNTIVAKNTIGGTTNKDVHGTIDATSSHNIFGAGVNGQTLTGARNQIGTATAPINPKLGALSDNGGPTRTHRIAAYSPAFDAGSNIAALDLVFDQRGRERIKDGYPDGLALVDIGAYEADADDYLALLDA